MRREWSAKMKKWGILLEEEEDAVAKDVLAKIFKKKVKVRKNASKLTAL